MTRAQLGVLHWQPGAAESGIRRRLGKLYADYYALNCRDFVMNQLGYIGLEPCCAYVLSNVGMELLMRRVPHVEREAFSAEKQYQLGDGAQLLLHDLMVSQVRVSFQQTQRQWQAKGIPVQVGWRNERQSILQHMHKKQENDMPWELSRPDATALFRTPDNLYTYFLELDRGGSDWEAKVKHYHNALRFSNWQRQLGVERFPPILCVLPPEAFPRLGRWLRGQGEQVQYYHQDGQPLVRQTSDEQGHITLAWGYSPSGATLYGEEGPVTNLDCGAIYDWGTGLIYKNGNYFDPNLKTWLSFAPLVVWQAWISQQKKRHTGQKANNRRAILLLTLATLLLTAGCTSPGPLDPTATTLPTQTPTCTPTLPPPVIGQIPTNTPGVPNTPTPPSTASPAADNWEKVGAFKASAYYLPYEGDYPSTNEVPIPAAQVANYLSKTEDGFFYNDDIAMAQTAYEGFLYDSEGVCLQGSGQLRNGRYISCVAPPGTAQENIKFDWTPLGRIENLVPFETVAVCSGGSIPHPTLDNAGNLQGETPELKLEGEGIENFFRNQGKDNIVKVTDVGEGLCPGENPWGQYLIDIYIGVGDDAFDTHYLDAVNAGEMMVYIKR